MEMVEKTNFTNFMSLTLLIYNQIFKKEMCISYWLRIFFRFK